MDIFVAIVLLMTAYLLLRVAQAVGRGSTGGRRTYYAPLGQEGDGDKLEEDAIYLWSLRCAGKVASRRALVRRGDMTHSDWNKASHLITSLNLDVYKTSKEDGIAYIRSYLARQRELAKGGAFVHPWHSDG